MNKIVKKLPKQVSQKRLTRERRERLCKEAIRGNVDSAQKMLQHAMAALSKQLRELDATDPDYIALSYLHSSLWQLIVDGLPINRAFGVEHEGAGAPKKRGLEIRNIILAHEVCDVYHKNGGKISVTQKKVAKNNAVSYSVVRAAWEKQGGKKWCKSKQPR